MSNDASLVTNAVPVIVGTIQPPVSAREHAPNETFLDPGFAFGQLSIRRQASELGAGAGAAWGTVICFSRTENEVARMRFRADGGAKQFDVVDLRDAMLV